MIVVITLVATIVAWLGLALVLDTMRWCTRPRLFDRLRPYSQGAMGRAGSVVRGRQHAGVRAIVRPAVVRVGESIARLTGTRVPLAHRLRQIHATVEVTDFRMGQVGWSILGGGVGCGVAAVVAAPGPILLAMGMAGSLAGFLIVEQQLASKVARRRHLVRRELSVIAEQLGMLMAAGFSLGGALERIAKRGSGATAMDLGLVILRMQQGADIHRALGEWADRVDIEAVHRLVAVLALDRHSGDLPRLIAAEARALRRDLHRDLVAELDRRAQQVWIPVTVATLLPGAILIGVPFSAALSGFLGG